MENYDYRFGIPQKTTDINGNIMITTQYPKPNEPINTYFAYDPINQLIEVTDAKGKKTISEYDKAGRRISVTHPASGKTTFEYDAAGNLIAKQTANLRKKGADHKIRYVYTYNRLDTIHYPDHPENDVVYTYGSASDNSGFNRKGRLVSLTDGSGAQEFKYGKLGEVTEVRRTLVIPNQAAATYTTRWNYDSWNRLLKMTYPDGEDVKYFYNEAGLLNKVTGEKPGFASTNYVTDIQYDEFEQRSYIKYGNGTETNYTYKPENRLLNTLSVEKGGSMLMNNAYTYDAVQNITGIVNSGDPNNTIGGDMTHHYYYDNLYRLDSASGDFIGYNGKKARYNLSMGYDNMHNITRKKQDVVQNGIKFGGILNAGYDLSYSYADNSQQIANIAEQSYRVERASQATYQAGSQAGDAISSKAQTFAYDANGNMTFVATGKLQSDSTLQATSTRKMLWDEENRLLAVSDNGFVSNYWYDASGERTVKESFDNEGVYINGVLSGARTSTGKFTAYISPYMVVNNGGNYTKHIYMGSQRITSKIGNSGIFTSRNPMTDTTALNKSYTTKLASLTTKIKERFDSLGVKYSGTAQTGGIVSLNPDTAYSSYFYHSDHLGSSSLITNQSGSLVQHIEYVPFGETFIDERNGNWNTPYLFNGKEQDEETGLHYYGARYYDSRTSVWLSVDPLAEKYPNIGSYVYCADNPAKYVDPDGRQIILGGPALNRGINILFAKIFQFSDFQDGFIILSNLLSPLSNKPTARFEIITDDLTGSVLGINYVPIDGEEVKDAYRGAFIPIASGSSIRKVDDLFNVFKFSYAKGADGFSAKYYRRNLQIFTGRIAKGYDAHHTFLKSQAKWFKTKGIDVHDPKNMVWRNRAEHSSTAEGALKSAEHQKLWEDFIETNPYAQPKDVIKQRDIIETKVWGNTTGDTPIK